MVGHLANCPTILSDWFDQLAANFSYKEVQFK